MYEEYIKAQEQLKSAENKEKAIKELIKESFIAEGKSFKRENGYIFNYKKNKRTTHPQETVQLLAEKGFLKYLVSFSDKQIRENGLEKYIESTSKNFSVTFKRSKLEVVPAEEFKNEFEGLSQEDLLPLLSAAKKEVGHFQAEKDKLEGKIKSESNGKDISTDFATFKWKEKVESLDLEAINEENPELLLKGKLSNTKLNEYIDLGLFNEFLGEDAVALIEFIQANAIVIENEPFIEIISEEANEARKSQMK